MILYLAGPMRAMPNYGFQVFEGAKQYLLHRDFQVVSPHDIDINEHRVKIACRVEGTANGYRRVFEDVELSPTFSMAWAMRRDLTEVAACDGIVLLPGWRGSVGATREAVVAYWCGLRFFEYTPAIPEHHQSGRLTAIVPDELTLIGLLPLPLAKAA